MIIFPWLEKICEYFGKCSWVYWLYVVVVGILGALTIIQWSETGGFPKVLGIITLFIWLVGAELVADYEKHWWKKKKL